MKCMKTALKITKISIYVGWTLWTLFAMVTFCMYCFDGNDMCRVSISDETIAFIKLINGAFLLNLANDVFYNNVIKAKRAREK